MSEDELPPLQKAFLVPATWQHVDIEEVEQDDAGVYQGARECCAVICEGCETVIDAQGVRIVKHPGDPYFVRRG
ncbi:hypothetical protein ACO2RV_17055 [Ancylobacter sp. VNQ12]|uniref:hypothetical protein n=1 Tax=Ancylobacter sp. VNQ12 TaxID=3400920 RepID=UPI003C1065E2